MDASELLSWARGPALGYAFAIFLFGMILRLFEVYSMGRKKDLAPARTQSPGSGWRTVFSRSFPSRSMFKPSMLTYITGYTFHIGFLLVLLFLVPHIELIHAITGLHWPALPTPIIDLITVATIIALIVALISRVMNPVKRFLSTFGDYLAWSVTILPLLTGYLAYHHLLLDYTWMLALHILSVELLLVVMPFTKLTHMVTLFIARWYNGDWFARKGVAS